MHAVCTWFLLMMVPPQTWDPRCVSDTCQGNASDTLLMTDNHSTEFKHTRRSLVSPNDPVLARPGPAAGQQSQPQPRQQQHPYTTAVTGKPLSPSLPGAKQCKYALCCPAQLARYSAVQPDCPPAVTGRVLCLPSGAGQAAPGPCLPPPHPAQ